ncbi:MAG TPA: DUF2293 domain-containing protein [Chloroflexota bacterium]|nr:DUF2293 domain-containing protein [Chloroflexota bacterium]
MEPTTVNAIETAPPGEVEAREIVVFSVRRDAKCGECDAELFKGSLLRREGDGVLCLKCADLDRLDFLPRGDTALTRRARKYSTLQAVVVEWSRSRQRYERQGVLVEPDALLRAENECLADSDSRARQRARAAMKRDAADGSFVASFVAAIRADYPGCPAAEAKQIAEHACQRSSGRIGRTAAARALDPAAVRLAVQAHVRHRHTNYDRLLGQLWDRRDARDAVHDDVADVLRKWAEPSLAGGSSSATRSPGP